MKEVETFTHQYTSDGVKCLAVTRTYIPETAEDTLTLEGLEAHLTRGATYGYNEATSKMVQYILGMGDKVNDK